MALAASGAAALRLSVAPAAAVAAGRVDRRRSAWRVIINSSYWYSSRTALGNEPWYAIFMGALSRPT
jgi:hypothetical protein